MIRTGTSTAAEAMLLRLEGETVTVVPEIATDWPASRSMSSEVDVLLTVIAVGYPGTCEYEPFMVHLY